MVAREALRKDNQKVVYLRIPQTSFEFLLYPKRQTEYP
jgi:hypothetical protein